MRGKRVTPANNRLTILEHKISTKMARKITIAAFAGIVPLFLLAGAALFLFERRSLSTPGSGAHAEVVLPPVPAEASAGEVRQLCGVCHAYPPPESFPRAHWRKELAQAYDFLRNSGLSIDYPSLESVAQYYENRAPLDWPLIVPEKANRPLSVAFKQQGFHPPGQAMPPAVANVNLVHLFDKHKLDILVCDMRSDQVLVLRPYQATPTWQVVGHVLC